MQPHGCHRSQITAPMRHEGLSSEILDHPHAGATCGALNVHHVHQSVHQGQAAPGFGARPRHLRRFDSEPGAVIRHLNGKMIVSLSRGNGYERSLAGAWGVPHAVAARFRHRESNVRYLAIIERKRLRQCANGPTRGPDILFAKEGEM